MPHEDDVIERVGSTPILSLVLPLAPDSSLVIRPYKHSDAPSLAAAANHSSISRNLTDAFPHPYTLEHAKSWISKQLDVDNSWKSTVAPYSPQVAESDLKKSKVPLDYVITVHDNDKNNDDGDEPIGTIGIVFQTDVECRSAEVGYWLTPAYWNKGIMGTVAPAFLDWAFNTFPYLVRVVAKVYSWNKGSMMVCEKAGMGRESVMRKAVWKSGRLGDLVLYVKLREDDGEKYEAFQE